MSEHPFNLQGAEYWTNPFKNKGPLMFSAVTSKRTSVTIDAPPDVDFAERRELPIPVLHVASQRDLAKSRFQDLAVLVGARLEDGRVEVAQAMLAPPAAGERGDDESDESVYSGGMYKLDARARLGIPAERGTWLFTVLLRDVVSNRVATRVGKSADWDDPEVERFLARQPVPAAPAIQPPPGAPLPTYFSIPTSPALPATPGIALDAPRVVVLKPGEKTVVTGSFRVAVRPSQLTARPASAGYPLVAGRVPTAIVPITVIALSSANREPLQMVLHLQVPSFDATQQGDADPIVTGYFAFDLLAQRGVRREAHTYFLYAFCGEHMSGPVPVGLVTESMLPGQR